MHPLRTHLGDMGIIMVREVEEATKEGHGGKGVEEEGSLHGKEVEGGTVK